MLQVPKVEGVLDAPRLIFTRADNAQSSKVISALSRLLGSKGIEVRVFETDEAIAYAFANGHSPQEALVIYDEHLGSRHFHPTYRNRNKETRFPAWAGAAQWGVVVNSRISGRSIDENRCARQIAADFHRNFRARLEGRSFPWGHGRLVSGCAKDSSAVWEQPPAPVTLPAMEELLAALNSGPNLKDAMADRALAAELPTDSNISWIRVLPGPLTVKFPDLRRIMSAFMVFEQICDRLVRQDAEVQRILLGGVDIDPALKNAYLFPGVTNFSVARPDLHYAGANHPFASENDEMPGGFAEICHIDNAYGINTGRWEAAFKWLCDEGPLVFLVSSGWSKCYIPEIAWLTGHMQRLGYDATMVTTDDMSALKIREDGVYLEDRRIGTIWRQFPVFEAEGKLVDLVLAAYRGAVRMVPEFAHFGNKAWFSVFRTHEQFFRDALNSGDYGPELGADHARRNAADHPASEMFATLDELLPHSFIVAEGCNPFPFDVDGVRIEHLEHLKELPVDERDQLVLKICGANTMAARSYGILMGHGIEQSEWATWIDTRLGRKQPFIVQRRLESGVARLPVLNTVDGAPELFNSRVLMRPWRIGSGSSWDIVTIHGCAVPSYTLRVHGMVSMAVVPFALPKP